MAAYAPTRAQQAVNVVAAVMAGHPPDDVAAELDGWLERRGAVLPEPVYAATVAAIAAGSRAVSLPAPRATDRSAPTPCSTPPRRALLV